MKCGGLVGGGQYGAWLIGIGVSWLLLVGRFGVLFSCFFFHVLLHAKCCVLACVAFRVSVTVLFLLLFLNCDRVLLC